MPSLGLNWLLMVGIACSQEADQPKPEARPATAVASIHRPDHQLEILLDWFQGSRHATPANALAALRLHSADPGVLSKGTQAAIALLNREMVRELQSFDGASGKVSFRSQGSPQWWIRIPGDDGTIRAVASALTLGDGAQLKPDRRLDRPVERLGPPGAPLLIENDPFWIFGSSTEPLLEAISEQACEFPGELEGMTFELKPARIRDTAPSGVLNGFDFLRVLGINALAGQSRLDSEGVWVECRSQFVEQPGLTSTRLPSFSLAGFPTLGPETVLAGVLATDPKGRTIQNLFSLADAIRRARGEKPGPVPLRTQVNLATATAGLFLDRDVWPKVDAIGATLAMSNGQPSGALIALHLRQANFATPLAEKLVQPIRRLLRLGKPLDLQPEEDPEPAEIGEQGRALGPLAGKTAWVSVHDGSVWIAWGTEPPAWPQIIQEPSLPLSPLPENATTRVQLWPGRLLTRETQTQEVRRALQAAPPVDWVSVREGAKQVDRVRWAPLPPTIRALVDLIPPLDQKP